LKGRKLWLVVAIAALVVVAVPTAIAAARTLAPRTLAAATDTTAGGTGATGPLALNLTSDQLAKLKAIRDQFASETKDLRDQAAKLRSELRDLRRSQADQTQIDAKIAEIKQNQQAILDKALAYRDQIKAVLTPDQLSKLEDQAILRFGLGSGGFGGRGGGGLCGHGPGRGWGPGCFWGCGPDGFGRNGGSNSSGNSGGGSSGNSGGI